MRLSSFIAKFSLFVLLFGCDNTPAPPTESGKLSIQGVSSWEGNINGNIYFRFKVYLQPALSTKVTVNYHTVEGSAKSGTDFMPQQGTLVFDPTVQEATIEVPIVSDTITEGDEDFTVVLDTPTGSATIDTGTATGTIRNDDTDLPPNNDGYMTPESYSGYQIAWQDEFSGTALDASSWNMEQGGGGWGNAELQNYTNRPENVSVANGNLVITALKESYGGNAYTSARITTQNKRDFTFGRIDIRAKLPKGQGVWPALWMLGSEIKTIPWPASGEVDIMELLGHEPAKTYSTVHWGNQGATVSQHIGNSLVLTGGDDFNQKYHVFSLDWQSNKMDFYVDNVLFYTVTNQSVTGTYPFNKPFFFLFNVAVGGNWPGSPNASTTFPQQMLVDYIRVFQKK